MEPLPKRPYHSIGAERASRFRGALLGGAVGDALGAPVEFMSLQAIQGQFGPEGVRNLSTSLSRLYEITDDTQMTLFTGEGLLRAHVKEMLSGLSTIPEVVAHAYQRWLITQGVRRRGNTTGMDGWLITHKTLFSVRAPGNTCISALTARTSLEDRSPVINNSKGSGGIMRVAPVGLYVAARGLPMERAFTLGLETSALTHGHPTGQLPGAVLALIICELVQGRELPEAIQDAKALLLQCPSHGETLAQLEAALALAGSSTPTQEALVQLGQGWIAEEAMGIALYCSLRAENLEEGVIMAANISGDSDSTAAITGNVLGAALGIHEIPNRWLDKLELKDALIEMADDLATVCKWKISPFGHESPDTQAEQAYWLNRYPAW